MATHFPYSCLENPMARGAWRAAVHEVAKNRTQLSMHLHTHAYTQRHTHRHFETFYDFHGGLFFKYLSTDKKWRYIQICILITRKFPGLVK